MAVMRDPTHEEYKGTRRWLGGGRFDPARFNARAVKFDHPGKRWKLAFGKVAQNRRPAKRAAVIAKPKARPQSRSARALTSVERPDLFRVARDATLLFRMDTPLSIVVVVYRHAVTRAAGWRGRAGTIGAHH
jgi:hypothetical protein